MSGAVAAHIKRGALATVLVLMALAIWKTRDRLAELIAHADWRYIAGASAIALVYLPLNASVWGLVIRSIGSSDISRPRAASIWIRGESMRYLPGGIWGYASRVVEAQRLGISKKMAGLSLTLELVLTAFSWGIVALVGLFVSRIGIEFIEILIKKSDYLWLGITAIAAPVATAVGYIAYRKFGAVVIVFAKKNLRPKIALRALAEYTILNLFFGLGFFLTFRAIAGDAAPSYFAATGVNAISWFAGMLAIGIPAGLGVREGACFLMFQPLGLGEEAAAAALLFRAVQMVVEFFVLSIATAIGDRPATNPSNEVSIVTSR